VTSTRPQYQKYIPTIMASSGGEGDSDIDDYEYAYSSGDEDDDDMNNNYAVDDDDRMDISGSGMKEKLDQKPAISCAPTPKGTSYRGTYETQHSDYFCTTFGDRTYCFRIIHAVLHSKKNQ
jgi:hypothetical protein